jgi:undecaprenyl-phosphate 4-deoxy-4-formamido-L-arabinose transferase
MSVNPVELRTLSVLVPVYQGEQCLDALVRELEPLTRPQRSARGRAFRVLEVVLIHDGAIDGSAEVIRSLERRHPFVRAIWLSRNYGQHAALLAGMRGSRGDWLVTLDEDGQHDPADIAGLLDTALDGGALLVYAKARNRPPHGALRNFLSRAAKRFISAITGNASVPNFSSFRLLHGELARQLAARCTTSVYLDVALGWVVSTPLTSPVTLREERGRPSGFTYRSLFSHFWKLMITAGTRPLRAIVLIGFASVLVGVSLAGKAVWEKLHGEVPVSGWASLMAAVCFFAGATLFSLAMIAEYLGLTLNAALGKPTFLTISELPRKESPAAEPPATELLEPSGPLASNRSEL